MGYTAGHLPNHFHLLRLLEGSFRLPAFNDFLMELLIGMFQLPCSGSNEILQLSSGIFAIEQMLPNLILPAPCAKSRLDRAHERDSAQRSLQKQTLPESSNRRRRYA